MPLLNGFIYNIIYIQQTDSARQEKFCCSVHRILMLLIFQPVCTAIQHIFWQRVNVCVYGSAWSSKLHPNPASAVHLNDTTGIRICGGLVQTMMYKNDQVKPVTSESTL